jgi:hypothetical protein
LSTVQIQRDDDSPSAGGRFNTKISSSYHSKYRAMGLIANEIQNAAGFPAQRACRLFRIKKFWYFFDHLLSCTA